MTTITVQATSPFLLSKQQEAVLMHRYYLRDANGSIKEDASSLFERVAKAISSIENFYPTLSVASSLVETEFLDIMQRS